MRSSLVAAVLVLSIAAAGCGGAGTGGISTGGDTARGEELFKQQCGSCHTLAAAGTAGIIGPDLDDAFASDREQGFEESSIQQVVAGQIQYPAEGRVNEEGGYVTSAGDPAMPADLVTGDDVDNVAAYVASVAGVPGAKPPPPAGGGQAADGKSIFTTTAPAVIRWPTPARRERWGRTSTSEASQRARRRPGDERRGRHAALQGHAQRC